MISEDSGSSSESEAAADLLDSVLGIGSGASQGPSAGAPAKAPQGAPQGGPRQPDRNKKTKKEVKKEKETQEQEAPPLPPYKGLKLELKGLPLEVGPPTSSSSSSSGTQQGEGLLRLQPHQKLLRLSIDGDPTADPAELLSAYISSLGAGNAGVGSVFSSSSSSSSAAFDASPHYIKVGDRWYSVQRGGPRGEVLLGPQPADTQLLTADRHLGQITFSRCEPPEEAEANTMEDEDDDKTWESRPSFARFHKIEQYGTNVKPKKPPKNKKYHR